MKPGQVVDNDPRIEALKDLEWDFHALVSMANIAELLLEDVQKHHRNITLESDLASFAYHDVTNKAEALKSKYFAALYPSEVQP